MFSKRICAFVMLLLLSDYNEITTRFYKQGVERIWKIINTSGSNGRDPGCQQTNLKMLKTVLATCAEVL